MMACRIFSSVLMLCVAISRASAAVRPPSSALNLFQHRTLQPISSPRSTSVLNLRGGGGLVRAIGTKEEFDSLIKSSGDKLIVVDFTATWCSPCQRIAPVMEQLAATNPGVIFVKVDVDANQETSTACDISCMPTFLFYKNGEVLHRLEGADEKRLTELVSKFAKLT